MIEENSISPVAQQIKVREWIVETGDRYWNKNSGLIRDMPVVGGASLLSGRMVEVPLPNWAHEFGVGSPPGLLVDESTLLPGSAQSWQRCDWFTAAYAYLTGSPERISNPTPSIHSYASGLRTPDPRIYEYAWVNRIFLFMRRWAAREAKRKEQDMFGPLPEAKIEITHDLDAVRLTPEIRFKQTMFGVINSVRAVLGVDWRKLRESVISVKDFAFSRADLWHLPRMLEIEDRYGIRSLIHIYGGPQGTQRSFPVERLFDPNYDCAKDPVQSTLKSAAARGWRIGLHPSLRVYADAEKIAEQKQKVEEAVGQPVTRCRQHWLRFDWSKSWRSQHSAGLTSDCTLGFNDQPAFRSGAALAYVPWDLHSAGITNFSVLPMVLMDSHLYDYAQFDPEQRRKTIRRWLGEVKAVHGVATVNWHPHAVGPPYGWEDSFWEVLEIVSGWTMAGL